MKYGMRCIEMHIDCKDNNYQACYQIETIWCYMLEIQYKIYSNVKLPIRDQLSCAAIAGIAEKTRWRVTIAIYYDMLQTNSIIEKIVQSTMYTLYFIL